MTALPPKKALRERVAVWIAQQKQEAEDLFGAHATAKILAAKSLVTILDDLPEHVAESVFETMLDSWERHLQTRRLLRWHDPRRPEAGPSN